MTAIQLSVWGSFIVSHVNDNARYSIMQIRFPCGIIRSMLRRQKTLPQKNNMRDDEKNNKQKTWQINSKVFLFSSWKLISIRNFKITRLCKTWMYLLHFSITDIISRFLWVLDVTEEMNIQMGVNRLYSRIFDNFKGHILKFLVFENKRNNDYISFHSDKKDC